MPVGFRKYIISALAIITFLFLFTRHHSAAPNTTPLHHAATAEEIAEAVAAGKIPIHTSSPETAPKKSKGSQVKEQQAVLGADRPLTDRLRYQYPYDPEGKFPAYIWQTWKYTPGSSQFADNLRPQEASWTEKHPNFVHEVITDDTAHHLIRYLYSAVPEVLEAYEAMPIPVLKADFFRYLILLARGGIYSDIDTEALKPATEWLPKDFSASSVGLIVGIEADPDRPDWHDWYSRRIQFCQWTIQSKPGHPVLREVVAQITEETLRRKAKGFGSNSDLHKGIIEYTGPGRWTDVLFEYMNDRQYFKVEESPLGTNVTWKQFTGMTKPKKIGDLVVLPITSFSPDVGTMGSQSKTDPMAYVKHDFEGSWKYASEHVKPVTSDEPLVPVADS